MTPERALVLVCAAFQLSREQVRGSSRLQRYVRARHVLSYLLAQSCGLTYKDVARETGRKDHTSAIHSVNACRCLMQGDEDFKALVERLERGEPPANVQDLPLPTYERDERLRERLAGLVAQPVGTDVAIVLRARRRGRHDVAREYRRRFLEVGN